MLATETHAWSPSRRRSTERAEAARKEALLHLEEHADEIVGAELCLRRIQETGGELALARREGALAGVAVAAGPSLFLEPGAADAALALLEVAGSSARRVWCKGDAWEWLRPWAEAAGASESRFLVLRTERAPEVEVGGARWAGMGDLAAVEACACAWFEETGQGLPRDWPSAIARREVALLEAEGRLGGVALRGGQTRRLACLWGTWTAPELRRQGLGRRVTGFLVRAMLESRPRVHVAVEEDDAAALGLGRGLGFAQVGRCVLLVRGSGREG